MNGGESPTVILKRDPNKDGNVFGGSYPLYFYYFTTSGSSTLTLQKDSNLADMSYYIESVIQVYSGSHLIMNLDSIGGQGLFGVYGGSILADGSTVEINNVNNFVIDKKGMMSGELKVTKGSTLKINNVDSLINVSSTSASASIYNNNSTLYIDADVYNYDKDTSTGGGYFRQTGENAKTTIGVLFIMLVLKVVLEAGRMP